MIQIGGTVATGFGGWIYLWDPKVTTNEALPSDGYASRVNVRHWVVQSLYEERPLYCSGLLGVPTTRTISQRFFWQMDLVWRPSNPPEAPAGSFAGIRQRESFSMFFMLGASPGTLVASSNWWWGPRMVATEVSPVVQGLKLTSQTIKGVSRGMMFFMQEDGVITSSSTIAGAYQAWLNSTHTPAV